MWPAKKRLTGCSTRRWTAVTINRLWFERNTGQVGRSRAGSSLLWREKRGEAEPEDLSGNLVVQLGVVTEG